MGLRQYNQSFLFILGLCLHAINKVRRTIIGYTSPRPFSAKDIEANVSYCLDVVKNWEKALITYSGHSNPFADQHVIEIGPGPDLGTGIIILALGAKSYTAVDKYQLIRKTPKDFYKILLSHLTELPEFKNAQMAVENLQEENFGEPICYRWNPDFNLEGLPLKRFNIMVSQAVLEHLNDVKNTFAKFKDILSPNAMMVHEIDLGAHTRFIRELDPLNHLRYSDIVWNLLRFNGSPNRLRIIDYQKILNQMGFEKIVTQRIMTLDKEYIKRAKHHLSKRFREYPEEDIETRSFYLLATKK
jgi:hypothetical protein